MLRAIILTFSVWFTFGGIAFAGEERTYRPGCKGMVSQYIVPLDTTNSKNRYFGFADTVTGRATGQLCGLR